MINWVKLHHGYAWIHGFRRLSWQELLHFITSHLNCSYLMMVSFIFFDLSGSVYLKFIWCEFVYIAGRWIDRASRYINVRSEANLHMTGFNFLLMRSSGMSWGFGSVFLFFFFFFFVSHLCMQIYASLPIFIIIQRRNYKEKQFFLSF